MQYKTAIGLMSGTSLDGIDVALIQTNGEHIKSFGEYAEYPYTNEFRNKLYTLISGDYSQLDATTKQLTELHANAVNDYLKNNNLTAKDIDIIGFHGQTIYHNPGAGITTQVGDGALLAKLTNISVINDFRSNDVKHGGQGAPLIPVFHRALADMAGLKKPLAFINIGGVANITYIASDNSLKAFDTGPGNALINDCAKLHFNQNYDDKGNLARQGNINEDLLNKLMQHPYFALKPPKSLDRNDFKTDILNSLKPHDQLATLTAFTAKSIALGLQQHCPNLQNIYLCGGGMHNDYLVKLITRYSSKQPDSGHYSAFNGDAIEAQGFGFLAVRSLYNLPLTFSDTTNCRPLHSSYSGGVFYPA